MLKPLIAEKAKEKLKTAKPGIRGGLPIQKSGEAIRTDKELAEMMGIDRIKITRIINNVQNGKISEMHKTFNPLIYKNQDYLKANSSSHLASSSIDSALSEIRNIKKLQKKKYLEKHPEEKEKLCSHGRITLTGARIISKFLGGNWNESRVSYLMVFSSRNLSMSDLRKRTLPFFLSLMYGKALSFISLSKVAGDIFKYSWTSFFVMNVSLCIASSLWFYPGKVNK